MISIAGIKYQKELETLPYFNKNQASLLIGKKGRNLDKKIAQLSHKGYLLTLKKGFYTTAVFYEKTDRLLYGEQIANILRSPSYLSLEYILSKTGMLPEAVYSFTSITSKSSKNLANFLGNFLYRNIGLRLFTGYETKTAGNRQVYIATPAKALFDFLYLKKLDHPKQEILTDLRLNWDSFGSEELKEFTSYVDLSGSRKMVRILQIIKSGIL